MSLESHYEFGTDVALSILAVIITMIDNHYIHLHISALSTRSCAWGHHLYQRVGAFNPTCDQRLECPLFLYHAYKIY